MIQVDDDYIDRLPKVELHLHLEGSVAPATLKRLSGYAGEDAERLYRYNSFHDFLMAFKKVCLMLRRPQDFELISYVLLANLARQNVFYAEIFFSPSIHRRNGLDIDAIIEAINRARTQAQSDYGIEMALILDCVRQWGTAEARYVLEVARAHRAQGVIGIGIGGDELAAPPEGFQEIYEEARAHGLRRVAHAGEVAGASSVWAALQRLGAERIGHGLSAAGDAELMDYLRENQAPLEISLTSNVQTGAIASLAHHPVRRFFDGGLRITLNTDDPAMFHTSLTAEYRLLADQFHFTAEELGRVARNGLLSSFLPEDRKAELLARFA